MIMTRNEQDIFVALGRRLQAEKAAAAGPAVAPPAPAAAPVSAPSAAAAPPPAADVVEEDPIDASVLDVEDMQALLAARGLVGFADAPVRRPTARVSDPRIAQVAASRAEASRRARADRLAPGAIDAREADPTAVRARLADLGIGGFDAQGILPSRTVPSPTTPRYPRYDEANRRRYAAEARVRSLLATAALTRTSIDARSLTPDEFAVLAQIRAGAA